ncbi:hypothetical protein F2P81_022556 [Scophthalmus maximus]|uniref:Uncharacterized protein n=1 Tax=Scophthalmus maximus TaxID=52904 RepID=A0A6A4S0B4_SCOMX|nr:hypothetical protein F2P81_022556 [Scophthalmus maximus]
MPLVISTWNDVRRSEKCLAFRSFERRILWTTDDNSDIRPWLVLPFRRHAQLLRTAVLHHIIPAAANLTWPTGARSQGDVLKQMALSPRRAGDVTRRIRKTNKRRSLEGDGGKTRNGKKNSPAECWDAVRSAPCDDQASFRTAGPPAHFSLD